jgi:SH3-like domain-containing protein
MRIIFILLVVLPFKLFAEGHLPYYKSLSQDESWLRHYPDIQDLKDYTEKFLLSQKRMPVKVIEEFTSPGNKYIDWYRIELFNGIQGWMYFNQLSRSRTLLIKEDTEMYAWSSMEPDAWLTIQKGLIQAPKIVKLISIEGTMAKISISTGKKSEEKAWIALDERVWGADKNERLESED